MISLWYPKGDLLVPHLIRHSKKPTEVLCPSYCLESLSNFSPIILNIKPCTIFAYYIHAYMPQFTPDFAFQVPKKNNRALTTLQAGIHPTHSSHGLPLEANSRYHQPASFTKQSISKQYYSAHFLNMGSVYLHTFGRLRFKLRGSCRKMSFLRN